MNPIEFVGFSDESYITGSRFRSISFVSYNRLFHTKLRDRIKQILIDSSVDEMKWKKIKDAKYKFCALKLIDCIFELHDEISLRIDTVVWDTQDSRHKIVGRDDTANYERMFFHLISNVLGKRRPPNCFWHIFPDEKNDIDWDTINQCLGNNGRKVSKIAPLLEAVCSKPWFYSIKRFQQVESDKCVQIQIADFFSGISVFSITNGIEYLSWTQDKHPNLFEIKPNKQSNREEARFEVIEHFLYHSSIERLSISFTDDKCLKTKYPNDFINFWHYEPQTLKDIAPTNIKKENSDAYLF